MRRISIKLACVQPAWARFKHVCGRVPPLVQLLLLLFSVGPLLLITGVLMMVLILTGLMYPPVAAWMLACEGEWALAGLAALFWLLMLPALWRLHQWMFQNMGGL